MAWLFVFTLFVSATLLFLVQPMIGKVIVPRFGGSPAVWNTCMLFFQAALLAAYSYAHLTPAKLGRERQARVHIGLLALPLVVLPLGWLVIPFVTAPMGLASDWAPPGDAHPVPWLLFVMALTIGLPFVVLATTAPLLQAWFAGTGNRSARDPYFLYAASNLGSMVALLGYPIFVEPHLGLAAQGWLWLAGYVGCAVLIGCCLLLVRCEPAHSSTESVVEAQFTEPTPAVQIAEPVNETAITAEPPAPPVVTLEKGESLAVEGPVTPTVRALWVARAFVPASLMLGVTTYITTDLAPMPLLWIVPLALYLMTFIIAFGRQPAILHHMLVAFVPLPVLVLVFLLTADPSLTIGWRFAVHLGTMFALCLALHGELAQTRPPARHLTEFYLWLALGGVLGGLFNALIAPLVFSRLTEYPLLLAVGCMLLPSLAGQAKIRWHVLGDLLFVVVLAGSALAVARFNDRDWPIRSDGQPYLWLRNVPADDHGWLAVAGVLWAAATLLLVVFCRRDWLNRVLDGIVPVFVAAWIAVHVATERFQSQNLAVLLGMDVAAFVVVAVLAVIYAVNRRPVPLLSLTWAAVLSIALGLVVARTWLGKSGPGGFDPVGDTSVRIHEALMWGFPLLLAALTADRPLRFGLCIGVVLVLATLRDDAGMLDRAGQVLHRDRSFFGACAVEEVGVRVDGELMPLTRRLMHGTTLHGVQNVGSSEALSYYHRTSPIGEIVENLEQRAPGRPIAVVGLGVGTMASYGKAGQAVDFYEIDPVIIRIARNPAWFTYLSDAEQRGATVTIHQGDGRLQLNRAPDGRYAAIVLDAFNSDAIPMHLFSREALQVFLRKLAPGGVIAFHISNRYLRLAPILGNLAHDAGLVAIERYDSEGGVPGKNASDWVMIARKREDFGDVPDHPGWNDLGPDPEYPLWTDDYSNLLSVYRWD